MRLILSFLLFILIQKFAFTQLEGNYVHSNYSDETYLISQWFNAPSMIDSFTIEYHLQPCTPVPLDNFILASMSYDKLRFMYYHSNKSVAFKVKDGVTTATAQTSPGIINIDTVTHLAITYIKYSKHVASVQFFFNGYLTANINYSNTYAALPNSWLIDPIIGAFTGEYNTIPAYIDQYRISWNLRYKQNFIPDSILMPDTYTKALWDFNSADTLINGDIVHYDLINNYSIKNKADFIMMPEIISPSGSNISGIDTVCINDSLFAKGAYPNSIINWSPGSIFNDSTIVNPIIAKQDTTVAIILSISDSNYCISNYDTLIIYIPPTPSYALSSDTLICYLSPVDISVITLNNYYWDHHPLISNPNAAYQQIVLDTGSKFFINVYNVPQCITKDSIIVEVSKPYPVIDSDSIICSGDTVFALAKGGMSYIWNPSNIVSDTTNNLIYIFPSTSTILSLVAYDTLGCTDTAYKFIHVGVSESIIANDTIFCSNGFYSLPLNYQYFTWSTGDSISSIYIDSSGIYSFTASDSLGCVASDSFIVIIHPLPDVNMYSRDFICDNDSVQVEATLDSSYIYNWWPGQAFVDSSNNSTTFLSGNVIDSIVLFIADSTTGCTTEIIKKFAHLSDCVWPGDVNNDLIANNVDLLPIGLTYNYHDTALIREEASLYWRGQASIFNQMDSSGYFYKYINTNGDSIINNDDTLAIYLNYGLTHNKRNWINQGTSFDPELYITTNIDSLKAGDSVKIYLNLGSSVNPANDVYGIAFSILTDPHVIDTSEISVDFSNNWLKGNEKYLKIFKNYSQAGRLDFAIVRTDKSNISGYGELLNLNATIKKIGGPNQILPLQFSEVILIDNKGDAIAVNAVNTDIPIYTDITYPTVNSQIILFPNPVNDFLLIEAQEFIRSVKIYDLSNRLLHEIKGSLDTSIQIDLTEYYSGVYIFQIETENLSFNNKVIISH